jgi:hypothetical protein
MDGVSFNKIDYIERKIKIKKLFLTSFEDIICDASLSKI